MSDAAIASIVTGIVTISTMVIGFLTLWIKLRYGVEKAEEVATKAQDMEDKIDHNTTITTEAKDAATQVQSESNARNEEMEKVASTLMEHHSRISALETQLMALKVSVDGVTRDITSTRHEMRGHFQTLVNKLDIMTVATVTVKPAEEIFKSKS